MSQELELYVPVQNNDKIYTALSKAQSELPFTLKTRKANYGNFADKFCMMQHVWPVLKKHGLSINEMIYILPNGKECLRVTLMHESGQSIISETIISDVQMTKENVDHTWAKSITYKSRTLYRGLLGIAIPNDASDIDDIEMPINLEQQSNIIKLAKSDDDTLEAICELYKVKILADIPASCYETIINDLKKIK